MYELPSGHEYKNEEAVELVTEEFDRLKVPVEKAYTFNRMPNFMRTAEIDGPKGTRRVCLFFGPHREPAVLVSTPSRSRDDDRCHRGLVPSDLIKLRRIPSPTVDSY